MRHAKYRLNVERKLSPRWRSPIVMPSPDKKMISPRKTILSRRLDEMRDKLNASWTRKTSPSPQKSSPDKRHISSPVKTNAPVPSYSPERQVTRATNAMVTCLQRWQTNMCSTPMQVWKCHSWYKTHVVQTLKKIVTKKESEMMRCGFRQMSHLVRVTSSVSEQADRPRNGSWSRKMKKLFRLMQGAQEVSLSSSVSINTRSIGEDSMPSSVSEKKMIEPVPDLDTQQWTSPFKNEPMRYFTSKWLSDAHSWQSQSKYRYSAHQESDLSGLVSQEVEFCLDGSSSDVTRIETQKYRVLKALIRWRHTASLQAAFHKFKL